MVAGVAERPVSIDAPNTVAVRAGDQVGLAIDPGAVRLFPKD
jgi:putative spermidine/putrescine transport system ATP-binding protein